MVGCIVVEGLLLGASCLTYNGVEGTEGRDTDMRIMCLPDLHAPFHHKDALDFLRDIKKEVKPDKIVCMGDEIDAHGWSVHDRNPDAPGQGEELKQAISFLRRVYKIFPEADVCTSNHTMRAYRKAIRCGLPSAYMRDTHEVLESPTGWTWRDHWVIDDVVFKHGEGYSGQNAALNAAVRHRAKTVIGHVHSWAGIQYHANEFNTIWGMNVGCLVDSGSLAMAYAKEIPNKQVLGTGAIIDGEPHFFPMR